jgi:hypothetical protein
MTDIAKNEYTKNSLEYLNAGDFRDIENINDCLSVYSEGTGLKDGESYLVAYFLILNPDHPNYDQELTRLECDFGAWSIHFGTIHTGFIEGEGEVGRVVLIPKEMSEGELRQIMPSIIFDLYRIK